MCCYLHNKKIDRKLGSGVRNDSEGCQLWGDFKAGVSERVRSRMTVRQ